MAENTHDQANPSTDDDEYIDFDIDGLLMGEVKKFWPNWQCTKKITENTRPSRKAKRLRGNQVTPLPFYSFHTPFTFQTDGKQWVIQSASKNSWHRVNALLMLFFATPWLIFSVINYVNNVSLILSASLSVLFLVPALYFLYKGKSGGEDTWVVFDRESGNVCFWRKNEKNSLTVPFEKVNCYWIRVFHRSVSHNLYFMPTENLPNERHRWWQVYMGFPTEYEEAQFFWRVLTDFMDKSKPIPEVPGLIHQVRWVQKNGYTIEDITAGGKEFTDAEFIEIHEEIQNDIAAVEARLRRLIEPENFNADTIIQFYKNAPIYVSEKILQIVVYRLKSLQRYLKDLNLMDSGFKEYFTMDQYLEEIKKLTDFFDPIFEAREKALGLDKTAD